MSNQRRYNIKIYNRTCMSYGRDLMVGLRLFADSLDQEELWIIASKDPLDFDLQELLDDQPDGIISQAFDESVQSMINETGIPWVNVGRRSEQYDSITICNDDEAIGRIAAEDLLERGITHFGYIDNGHCYSTRRYEGFRDRLQADGLSCVRLEICRTIFHKGRNDEIQKAIHDTADWLRHLTTPCGILICNDHFAAVTHQACRVAGINIPYEIAIIGVDNDTAICESYSPSLSSIQTDAVRVGREAGAFLKARFNDDSLEPKQMIVPPSGLITRASSSLTSTYSPEIQKALRYIREHASRSITVQHVAQELGISRRQLELRFRDEIGSTPAMVLRRTRIESAKELLRKTDLTMQQIVKGVGLKDTNRFSRHFEIAVGMRPQTYRQKFRP